MKIGLPKKTSCSFSLKFQTNVIFKILFCARETTGTKNNSSMRLPRCIPLWAIFFNMFPIEYKISNNDILVTFLSLDIPGISLTKLTYTAITKYFLSSTLCWLLPREVKVQLKRQLRTRYFLITLILCFIFILSKL